MCKGCAEMEITMRLTELLKSDKVTISCELFPPKQGTQLENYKKIVADMAALRPAYMSVTYGATGGTSDYTVELANEVRNVNHIPALAHLTCASSTKDKVSEVIRELKEKQIENILALRGDIPANADFPLPNQYHHASELIADIKAQGDFCIGGACYPEGHPEADTIFEDLNHLKEKVDAGCEFLTTQMFFDNNIFYNFMYKALKTGIDVPVVAGIMPITSKSQVKRSISLSGCMIPARFQAIVDRFGDDPAAMKQAGIAYATDQIIDLIANGVNHVHIYTMNKPDVAGAILENLSDIYVRA
jgi:methylenetetrahydrofolate reductase (NADPH)